MAQQHDGDQCREFPPERLCGNDVELDHPGKEKSHYDGQRNQGHHAGQTSAQLSNGSLYEDPAPIEKHERGQ